jgi:REP element-mobilizing transposase RayT
MKRTTLTTRRLRAALIQRKLRVERLEPRETPDVSAPAILQWFESTYATMERRMVDFFRAGYGITWTPPSNRADSGNQSVGYDVYDRFDLGGPNNPTLYGTETGLKQLIRETNKAGGLHFVDLVWNHNGFSDRSTPGFVNAGGYPGLWIGPVSGSPIDGDFHAASESGVLNGRLSGLIDINQSTNNVFVRNPVPGFANNIPAGTTPLFGRLANVPSEANRRFFPDQGLTPIMVFDPTTGEANIPIYPFNNASPMSGDPTASNALGYLMRNAQWLVQAVGVDGFRLDAVKHMPTWVLNYFDRAVYRSSLKPLLNGQQPHVFSFGEVFDGSSPFLQQFVRKDINPNTPGVIGGNRDVLDFPLYFAMMANLSGNGLANDWNNIVNASFDAHDDGLANNGSQGVAFVQSHDEFGPFLSNVAHAFTLMRPGNAIVYFNARQFGPDRDFPKDGRGDALGGQFGNTITRLVQLRNAYGRGNYIQRYLTKESLIFERQNSALVVLSNRLDGGFDSVTVQTSFPPGTHLLEQTGNAANPTIDPFNDFPEVVTVQSDGKVNLRIPRNRAPGANGVQHNTGYFIYAPSGPQGAVTIVGASGTIAADTPTPATNGTAVLTSIPVITGNSFQIKLNTTAVNLLGIIRDADADGDNALFRIDGGIDANGNGKVDFTTPGEVSYGFEQFVTIRQPGFGSPTGNGTYVQTIDATQLSEGVHYITVRAFRRRTSGPAIFTDFRVPIFVNRLAANSPVESFAPIVTGVNENRRVTVRSADLTANNVHMFLNLPPALTNAQILAAVSGSSQSNQVDRDLWWKDFNGVANGNHVITVVTYERDGSASVQRFPGFAVSSIIGAGTGDLNFDGVFSATDVNLFSTILNSNGNQFNPAADFNGDGFVNTTDLLLFGAKLTSLNATAALNQFRLVLGPPVSFTIAEGGTLNLNAARPTANTPPLSFSWDLNNDGVFGDATGVPTPVSWSQLVGLGVDVAGSFPVRLLTSEGTTSYTQTTTLNITPVAPTAALTNNGPVGAGSPNATVSFGPVSHPSPPTLAAGFTYSFDFNNDGVFEITDGSSPSATVPPSFLVAPSVTVRGRVTSILNGLSGDFTTNLAVVVPPRVAGVTVNNGSPQRSRVTQLTVNFDAPVVLPNPPELAFELLGPGSQTIGLSVLPLSPQSYRLTFSGPGTSNGSLNDGRYSLRVLGQQVTAADGTQLDGDNNGNPGGDFTLSVHRLFGDADGDATITVSDFVAFRLAFLSSAPEFDFDGDGSVNAADFLQFRLRFLQSV